MSRWLPRDDAAPRRTEPAEGGDAGRSGPVPRDDVAPRRTGPAEAGGAGRSGPVPRDDVAPRTEPAEAGDAVRSGHVLRDVLVFFARDPVDDALAKAIVARVRTLARMRPWPGSPPRWFDDPDAPSPAERTTGGYLRVSDLACPEATAMLVLARELSAEHGIAVEVQWRERRLGHIERGVPGDALAALLA